MSVLIRGMDMPKNCWECPCEIAYPSYGSSVCGVTSRLTINNRDTRRNDCPLVPVPPHGRLIDADILLNFVVNRFRHTHGDSRKSYREVFDAICAAGDVIEEWEGKE